MDTITFIPDNQKQVGPYVANKPKDIYRSMLLRFGTFLLIYFISLLAIYFIVVVGEKSKLTSAIKDVDVTGAIYYPKGDFVQSLFNINDIISKSFNPSDSITQIESAYIPNSRVNSMIYDKAKKTINLSMVVPYINDVSTQVKSFGEIPIVAKVDFASTNTLQDNSGVVFEAIIVLK